MRKQAIVVRWEEARGFGFLRSPDTPADVFFHVRDWTGGRDRPVVGQEVVYEEIHVGGKGPRGMAVRPLAQDRQREARHRVPSRRPRRADSPAAPMLILVVAYAAVIAWAALAGRMPVGVALSVPLVSGFAFLLYWHDKNAAQRRAWRTSEQTLHLASLMGGWPGAWFAQRLLRHKSVKPSFRATYWGTVVAHCAALAAWLAYASRA